MMRMMGPKCMSSDESSKEDGVTVYRVSKKAWRDDIMTLWLRTLDALHRRDRYNEANSSTRGAAPHLRVMGTRTSKRAPPPHLPINAFKPSYLRSLTEYDRELLHVQAEVYNFQHTAEILL